MATLTLESPPGDLAGLILQSVCDHLRRYADLAASPVVAPADLEYIRQLTRAAVALVDGPNGKLGRCLLTQSWRLLADEFQQELCLPLPPVTEVTLVRYLDATRTWQVLASDTYRLFGAGSWSTQISAVVSWPSTADQRESVEVVFVSGYGSEAEDVPAPILQAVRLLVAHWYMERQPVTFTTPHEIPLTVSGILAPYRVYR